MVRGRFGPFLSSLSSSATTDESSESESPLSVLLSFSGLKLLLLTSGKNKKTLSDSVVYTGQCTNGSQTFFSEGIFFHRVCFLE